jgi:hypothetical protein
MRFSITKGARLKTALFSIALLAAFIPAYTEALVTNVSIPRLFSYAVVQQPRDDAGFVSLKGERVTEFAQALVYGRSRGLLADNKLAGSIFPVIGLGDRITIEYDDGTSEEYNVVRLRHFQALTPTSPYSNFIDLADGEFYTAAQVFHATYGIEGALILQTCIVKDNEWAWGRLFVIGKLIEPEPRPVYPDGRRVPR